MPVWPSATGGMRGHSSSIFVLACCPLQGKEQGCCVPAVQFDTGNSFPNTSNIPQLVAQPQTRSTVPVDLPALHQAESCRTRGCGHILSKLGSNAVCGGLATVRQDFTWHQQSSIHPLHHILSRRNEAPMQLLCNVCNTRRCTIASLRLKPLLFVSFSPQTALLKIGGSQQLQRRPRLLDEWAPPPKNRCIRVLMMR